MQINLGSWLKSSTFKRQLKHFSFSQLSREPETLQVLSEAHIMYNCTPPNSSRKSTKHLLVLSKPFVEPQMAFSVHQVRIHGDITVHDGAATKSATGGKGVYDEIQWY